MGIETETRAINGSDWQVTQWPARKSLKLKTRMVKLVGPTAGRLLSGGLSGMDEEMDISSAVDALVDRLNPDTFDQLVQDLLSSTRIEGKEANQVFDQHFAGNFSELYQGLAFVLEVNYGDFTSRIRDAIGNLVRLQDGSETQSKDQMPDS